jgi:hypothetical protein
MAAPPLIRFLILVSLAAGCVGDDSNYRIDWNGGSQGVSNEDAFESYAERMDRL